MYLNLETDPNPVFFPSFINFQFEKNFHFENVASDQIKYLL